MSASRNAGVAAARGEHIGFLDCDDVWLPTALSHGLRVLALHPDADVVIGGTWRWHGWTGDPADRARDHLMSLPDVAAAHDDRAAGTASPRCTPTRAGGGSRRCAACSSPARSLLRIGGLDVAFRGLYEDQVLYAKIGVHLRAVVDPRPMALYRQHDASACQVAIDAGEWQRIGPSEPERRYLEWMRTYVTEQAAGDAAALDVVARNLDHAAHGRHLAPTEPPPSLRERCANRSAAAAVRTVRRRLRPPAPPTTVAGRWSEQFLAPVAGPIEGATLVVEADDGGEPWVAAPPADVVRRPHDACVVERGRRRRRPRFDRVVVPLGVAARASARHRCWRRGPSPGTATARRTSSCPVRRCDPTRPDPDALAGLVHAVLPHHRVDTESFGNATTAGRPDAPAAALGPLVDRHDPAVPVVLGITIDPRRAAAR